MEYCKTWWICVYVFVFAVYTWKCEAQIKNVTACFGTANCNLFDLTCDRESSIRVLEMMYGLKDYNCNSRKNRCLTNSNGCCVYKPEDCFEDYTPLHAYNLYRECSTQKECGPLQAPNNILTSCNEVPSTYVYLKYECIPYTDTNRTIDVCEDKIIYPGERESSILFTAASNTFRGNTCSCRVSGSDITTTFVDIRMFKHKSGTGSTCSSARLSTNLDNQQEINCVSSSEEENNFVYNDSFKSKDVTITLNDLNKEGAKDIPSVVWILVEGASQIECSTSVTPVETTQPVTSTPQSNGTLEAKTEEQNESDSSIAGIIAGVVVGTIVVVVVVGIVIFIFFKRRNNGPKRMMARENSYTASSSVRSTSNSIYDEINDNEPTNTYDPVYESKKHEPHYDPVYEPKLNTCATGSSPENLAKTLTYQNVGKGDQHPASSVNESKGRYVIPKRLKAPFSKVKKQTSKFVDFVKSRTGQEPSTPKQRPREASGGSYDHLRVGAVAVEVTQPTDEPSHAYSHAAAVKKAPVNQPNDQRSTALQAKDIKVVGLQTKTSEIKSTTLNTKKAIIMKPEGTKGLKPCTDTIEKVPSETDLQAVHVGDEYIEFQFDVHEDNPNIVKMKEPDLSANHLRPTPPSRDPPSPKLSRAPSPLPKSSRSPNPIAITAQTPASPIQYDFAKEDSEPSYDYADPNRLSPRLGKRQTGRESSNQNDSEVDVPDEQPSYDYADVSEGEDYVNSRETDSVYEDVERRLREASVKKHMSEADINLGSKGYEVPVTSQSRPTSSPSKTSSNTPHYENLNNNNRIPLKPPTATTTKQNARSMDNIHGKVTAKPKENNLDLKSELQQKLKLTNDKQHITPSNKNVKVKDMVNDKCTSKSVVKSDNVSTKDYEKPPDKRSVLNLAKTFEK